jgi:hypothetical protein
MRGQTAKAIRNSVMSHDEFVACKKHPRYAIEEGWKWHPGPYIVRSDYMTAYRQAKKVHKDRRANGSLFS